MADYTILQAMDDGRVFARVDIRTLHPVQKVAKRPSDNFSLKLIQPIMVREEKDKLYWYDEKARDSIRTLLKQGITEWYAIIVKGLEPLKKQRVRQKRRDIVEYVLSFPPEDQLKTFAEECGNMNDRQYWNTLRIMYVASAGGERGTSLRTIHGKLLYTIMTARPRQAKRHLLMDANERRFLKYLPNPVTVYRGFISGQNKSGLSWTLDRSIAAWFARRAALFAKKQPRLLEGVADKDEIIAYLNGRLEEEILVEPKHVKRQRVYANVPQSKRYNEECTSVEDRINRHIQNYVRLHSDATIREISEAWRKANPKHSARFTRKLVDPIRERDAKFIQQVFGDRHPFRKRTQRKKL